MCGACPTGSPWRRRRDPPRASAAVPIEREYGLTDTSPSSAGATPPNGGEPTATEQIVSLYQSDPKIHPRAVHGWFQAWRWALVWFTQLIFYGLPWLMWNERQAVLFDVEARRFFLFGLVMYPQDFIYLTALLVVSALSLFLFTAVAGRLWCGYACPQTVYTEIFLWVERHTEGDRQARIRLDQSGWGLNKMLRRGGKHVIWAAIALWTGFTFVGYFTPIRELGAASMAFALGPWQTFWILFYGFATYGNAGYMREQVCKYMCPYARFQSAMFDKDTLIITYDERRGEPRGSRARKADPAALGLGSCIDCTLCVQVCPTGIDIRKGLQYECIGCAACIDVCDTVMDKMSYPRGLIRYDTQNAMAQGWDRKQMLVRAFRPRVLVYTAVLWAIIGALAISLWARPPLRVDVVRDRNTLARMAEDGTIENVYRIQVINNTERVQTISVASRSGDELAGLFVVDGDRPVNVDPAATRWVPVRVKLPGDVLPASGSHPIELVITQVDGAKPGQTAAVITERSTFLVPR